MYTSFFLFAPISRWRYVQFQNEVHTVLLLQSCLILMSAILSCFKKYISYEIIHIIFLPEMGRIQDTHIDPNYWLAGTTNYVVQLEERSESVYTDARNISTPSWFIKTQIHTSGISVRKFVIDQCKPGLGIISTFRRQTVCLL